MIATYRFMLVTRCSADRRPDRYEVEVISHRTLLVEDILSTAEETVTTEVHQSQEDITVALAHRLAAAVLSRGCHFGVNVEVRA